MHNLYIHNLNIGFDDASNIQVSKCQPVALAYSLSIALAYSLLADSIPLLMNQGRYLLYSRSSRDGMSVTKTLETSTLSLVGR